MLDIVDHMCYNVPPMYVERTRKKQGEKVYEQILLRESYRVRKDKVDKRTLLNLTHFPREQVEAIEWALRNPQAVALAVGGEGVTLREGKSVGAVWAVAEAGVTPNLRTREGE